MEIAQDQHRRLSSVTSRAAVIVAPGGRGESATVNVEREELRAGAGRAGREAVRQRSSDLAHHRTANRTAKMVSG